MKNQNKGVIIMLEELKDLNEFITVENHKGLKLVLSTVGAGVYKIYYKDQLLTCSPIDENSYLVNPQFFGKTLGQTAGRLPKYQTLNGKKVLLGAKDNPREYLLHGGLYESVSFKNFEYRTEKTHTEEKVIFSVTLDNNATFPGKGELVVTYVLPMDDNQFSIEYDYVNHDSDSVINLSNHIYWNFNQDDILSYKLQVASSKTATTDKYLTLTGVEDVKAPFDFRVKHAISDELNAIENSQTQTIDTTYIFDNENPEVTQVVLENNHFRVTCNTSYDATNVYLCNNNREVPLIDIPSEWKYSGLAIEPQHFLLNNDKIFVKKGEKAHEFITYKINPLY